MERVMYNTVLGAKPLMADGRTFYYSDYSFQGRKIYKSDQHWSCCSGTLPQVAADYRINTYFHDPRGVWVNLYIPSTLKWKQDGAGVTLTQQSDYPFGSMVEFRIKSSHARKFALNLRIPTWSNEASISVNGKALRQPVIPGTFAAIDREWKNGDMVELHLPMALRLEPVDGRHPNTVALCFGPLALLAITDTKPSLVRAALLGAKRLDARTWQVETSGRPITMRPFTDIEDEQYSTYVNIT
jgi:DUF1680 family protein